MEQANYGKKITMGTLGFDQDRLKEMVEANPKEQSLAVFMALVTGMKVEPNKQDPSKTYVRFIGQVEARNSETGEVSYASQLIVPSVAEAYVEAIKSANPDSAVKVMFEVGIKKDSAKNSAKGYMFTCKPWVNKDEASDIFKDFRNLLPAPKKTEAKAAATGAKK